MDKKRCGLYIRVSTQEQSTDLQRNELVEYCKRRGWEITRIYEDKASGTSRANRKMFEELMADCKRRKIDVLIVWKLDRLFRSLRGMIDTLAQLSEWNVEFVSLTDSVSLESAQGKLLFHLISAFSEFEASLIKARVVAGLQAARARGVVLGRPQLVTKEISEKVIELRQSGSSIRQISNQLGHKISKTSVERILRDFNNRSKKGGL